jgi:predicted transcriptional regulator
LIARSLTLYYLRLMKDTTISFKLERGLKTKLVALAKAENRSLSNFIEKVLKEECARREAKHSRPKTSA